MIGTSRRPYEIPEKPGASGMEKLALLFSFVLLAPGPSRGVIAATPPAQEAYLRVGLDAELWDLEAWSDVRRGQVRVVHGDEGDRLSVSWLDSRLPPEAPQPGPARAPEPDGNCFRIDDFESSGANRLGGDLHPFSRAPSRSDVAFRDAGDGRWALEYSYEQAPTGFSGVSVRLWDGRTAARAVHPVDSRAFTTLSFWIRGAQGGERLLLKASDVRWNRLEDSLPVGAVGAFLPAGRILDEWQRGVVPLDALPDRLERSQLMEIIFTPEAVEAGTIFIKTLALCVAPAPLPDLPAPQPLPESLPPFERALWFWNTADVLDDPVAQNELVAFAHDNGFDHIFVQLTSGPTGTGAASPDAMAGVRLDVEKMRVLLGKFGSRGIRVHALDGDARFALPEYHPHVLASVRNVLEYNRVVEPDERFYGVHYDIEPYLLAGYGGVRTEEYLRSYLEVHAAMAELTRRGAMVFGADIPFWYDARDEYTGEPLTLAYEGVTKPFYQHVLDLMDNVGIMDYRTSAQGPDGTISHARDELAYAETVGTDVFVALETGPLSDESLFRFDGAPGRGLPEDPSDPYHVFVDPGATRPSIYLVEREDLPTFGRMLAGRGVAAGRLLHWGVRRRIPVPATKLTFAELGRERLDEVIEQSVRELSAYRSFRGIAIHHYPSLRALR